MDRRVAPRPEPVAYPNDREVDKDRAGNAAPDGGRLLARFGIPSEAEAVWRALIVRPEAPTDTLARECNLTTDEVIRAIDSLGDAGFLRSGPTSSGAVVVDPILAVESNVARLERRMAEQAADFAMLRAALPQLAAVYNAGRVGADDLPSLEVVVPLADIQTQIRHAARRVKTDIRSLEHQPQVDNVGNTRELEFEVLDRGVRDRAIVPSSVLEHPVVFADFLEMQNRGHETRTLPDVSTRLMIYDNDLAVLPIDPADMPRGAIFVRVRSLIEALILMYDHMWSVATPIFCEAAADTGPSGRPARILELLALGNKDVAIARSLGIGVRSVRRDVAELKQQLGAKSRAEVTVAAIRKGWL